MKKVHLLVIDPQRDFCAPGGALFVEGADQDMDRLAYFMRDNLTEFSVVYVSLDHHNLIDIAHPEFWESPVGENPAPFTIITFDDVKENKWQPANLEWRQKVERYVEELEKSKRYPLCIWPPHCLIGTSGACVVEPLRTALAAWESRMTKQINWINKGSNPFTEHYSAVKAEIPDSMDPDTNTHWALVGNLEKADEVLIAGEAGSHCVANTVRDLATHFRDKESIKKLVLIEDCVSPVTSFESLQEDFIREMKELGMRTTTTKSWEP